MLDQKIGSSEKLCSFDVEPFRSFFGYAKAIKGYFSHTGCPKKENGFIVLQKVLSL